MLKKIPSSSCYIKLLSKGINCATCIKCLNWNAGCGTHSKDIINNANGHMTKPRKLESNVQHSESEIVYSKTVDNQAE